jgi:hypothetical protein
MRGLAIAGILLASCTVAMAQDSPDRTADPGQQSGNWFTRLWSTGDKPAPKTSTATAKKTEPIAGESASTRRMREEVILNRRNEVILKLREIAQRTGDDALMRKADDLQERAWDLYLQRTANSNGGLQEARR